MESWYTVILTNHIGSTERLDVESRSEGAASTYALKWVEGLRPDEGWTVTSVL